jgi:predicted DNA-binding protein (MmcQ/YjbR family)
MEMGKKSDRVLRALRAHFLAYPGTQSRSPWPGHDALAVGDRTFAFLPAEGRPFSVTVKLPYTGEVALDLPYAAPTGYGLGRSGWVTFTPAEDEIPPLDQLKDWIDESYRARAPRKLVKELDSRSS